MSIVDLLGLMAGPVYKKNFQDGSTGYWDGWRSPDRSQTISGHHFKLPKGRPKSNLKGMEVDPQVRRLKHLEIDILA